MKLFIYIICITCILNSCIKPIDNIELEEMEPKIVLNGLIRPGAPVNIHVSKNIGLLDREIVEPIENATIELWGAEGFINKLTYTGHGFYTSSIPLPEDEDDFTIVATAPGYDRTYANVNIPSDPDIVSFDTNTNTIAHRNEYQDEQGMYIEEWNESTMQLDIKISDPPEEQNYYLLYIRKINREYLYDYRNVDPIDGYSYAILDSSDMNYNLSFSSKEPVFEIGIDYYTTWIADDFFGQAGAGFSDILFNGKNISLKLDIQQYEFTNTFNSDYTRIYIHLMSVNKDYYQFLKSLSIYSDDPFESFFVERAAIFTNVENGLGLIGGYSMSIDSFDVPSLNVYYY